MNWLKFRHFVILWLVGILPTATWYAEKYPRAEVVSGLDGRVILPRRDNWPEGCFVGYIWPIYWTVRGLDLVINPTPEPR